ncbi:MAG: DUF4412 domain-containing protein [Ignavibacteriae bacterium]|nr:DUF4412 domain-containing protein [Ignavibacteriota bacterium]NOH00054.1 DUF4412 domain-containing protein [Ignavibacteriota bacterium]
MKTIHSLLFIFFLSVSSLTAQTFTGSFDLTATQHYANGNIRSDTISYYFGKEKTAIMIYGRRNNPDMKMIFSPIDSTITTLFEMNDKKGGYILPMDEEHWPGMPQAFRTRNTMQRENLNYTGKEKIIEGFICKEVTAENDDYTTVLWLAEDIPLSMTRVLSYQSVGKGKSKKEIELFDQLGVEGLPLELFLKSKKGKADVTINLINFNESSDENIFSTEGHTLSRVE